MAAVAAAAAAAVAAAAAAAVAVGEGRDVPVREDTFLIRSVSKKQFL